MRNKPFTYRIPGTCEVGLWVLRECQTTKPTGDTPEAIFAFYQAHIKPSLDNPDQEVFCVLFLNARRKITGYHKVAMGSLDGVVVHPREVFRSAILASASAIVVLHNHPSGDPTPGDSDVKVSRDLIRAGQLLKIDVVDSLVMGEPAPDRKGYCSLRELGYFF